MWLFRHPYCPAANLSHISNSHTRKNLLVAVAMAIKKSPLILVGVNLCYLCVACFGREVFLVAVEQ